MSIMEELKLLLKFRLITSRSSYIQQKQNLTQHQLKDYQMFWMKYQLENYQTNESNIPIYCDNIADILLSNLKHAQSLDALN